MQGWKFVGEKFHTSLHSLTFAFLLFFEPVCTDGCVLPFFSSFASGVGDCLGERHSVMSNRCSSCARERGTTTIAGRRCKHI